MGGTSRLEVRRPPACVRLRQLHDWLLPDYCIRSDAELPAPPCLLECLRARGCSLDLVRATRRLPRRTGSLCSPLAALADRPRCGSPSTSTWWRQRGCGSTPTRPRSAPPSSSRTANVPSAELDRAARAIASTLRSRFEHGALRWLSSTSPTTSSRCCVATSMPNSQTPSRCRAACPRSLPKSISTGSRPSSGGSAGWSTRSRVPGTRQS